jgi:hypothetical protein
MTLSLVSLKATSSADGTKATVEWAPNETGYLGGCVLVTSAKSTGAFVKRDLLRPDQRSVEVAGLTPGATYHFIGYALHEEGAKTAEVTMATPAQPPPPSGAVVTQTPLGIPAPAGGWALAFADAFGSLNAWTRSSGQGHNSNELAIFTPGSVQLGPDGLELLVKYAPGCGSSYGSSKNYEAGEVKSAFQWQPNQGNTWCVEHICQLPSNSTNGASNGMDPGIWSTDSIWSLELDAPEWWGWGHVEYFAGMPVWVKTSPSARHEMYKCETETPNPAGAFHRYSFVIHPDNAIDVYFDGMKKWATPATNGASPWMKWLLQNTLRVSSALRGTAVFKVRSFAVYTDAGHAGQHFQNGGVAPGTTIR